MAPERSLSEEAKVPTKWKPPVVVLVAVAALVTMLGVSPAGAGARVAATNDKFCAVLSTDQGQSLNFEGLAPNEARFAANLLRKAARAGVPAKLKADLATIAKLYDRIAHGEPALKVLDAAQQKAILPGLTRFSKYVAANCTTPPT
jgi:hypothetical protein